MRQKMAMRYNTRHHVEIFNIGDLISVGIPREDRAKTDNKRLYCRIFDKPQPERHRLVSKYGILKGLYPTKALKRAPTMLELEEELPLLDPKEVDKHPTQHPTITLAYAARKASASLRISVSCTCKLKCTARCRCVKNKLKYSIYCHTKHMLPEDHDCGNLSTLATRTEIALLPNIAKKKIASGPRGTYHVVLCILYVPNVHT